MRVTELARRCFQSLRQLRLQGVLASSILMAVAGISTAMPLGATAAFTVTLTPGATNVGSGACLPFAASASGSLSVSMAWTVDGVANGNATVGTLTGSGGHVFYLAPATAGTHTVTATGTNSTGTASASTVVTVLGPAPCTVTLAPGASNLVANGSLAFSAAVSGSTSATVTWSVDGVANGNATVGTLTASGATATYKAPAAGGTHYVTATATINGASSSADTAVTVLVPPPVTLTPGTSTLAPTGSLSFSAAVGGSASVTLAWLVDGITGGSASVGTITAGTGSTATYKAPAVTGPHTVTCTATTSAKISGSGSSTLSVLAPATVALSPASAALNPSATVALSATVTGPANTAVTWTVDGIANGNATTGTLSGTGNSVTYTAPATAGSHAVVATSVANPTVSASAPISVVAPVALVLSPAAVTILPSTTQAFTASVSGSANTAVTWTVDGIAGGNTTVGTLTGTGNTMTYTAPATLGNHTVAAQCVVNTAVTASSAITVQNPVAVAIAVPLAAPTYVNTTGALLISAKVTGSANTGLTWSVDGIAGGNSAVGTIKGSGSTVIFTAPATAGSHTVTATSMADTSKSASTTLTVAATTVQVANPNLVVNVKNAPYNAAGNGIADDTAAIQAAVKAVAGTGGTVLVPAGTYMINPTANNNAGIRLGSNMTFSMQTGAILQALPTSTSNYYMVLVSGMQNVNITGGTVAGNRYNNTITDTTEAGMGIYIINSQNVVVENVVSQNCWADAFYISSSTNVTLSGVTANNSRRNGLSITSGTELVVRGSTFENATGSLEGGSMANGSGIDVEPNKGDTVNYLLVSASTFKNNYAEGIASGVGIANTGLAFVYNVFIDDNTVTGSQGRGIDVANCSGTVVTGNTCTGNSCYGILLHENALGVTCTGNNASSTIGKPGNGITVDTCANDLVTGNTCTGNAGYGVYVVASTGCTVGGNNQSGDGVAP